METGVTLENSLVIPTKGGHVHTLQLAEFHSRFIITIKAHWLPKIMYKMFIITLFIVRDNWKQFKSPLIAELIKK